MPAFIELIRESQSFLPAGSIEDGAHIVGYFLLSYCGWTLERKKRAKVDTLWVTEEGTAFDIQGLASCFVRLKQRAGKASLGEYTASAILLLWHVYDKLRIASSSSCF